MAIKEIASIAENKKNKLKRYHFWPPIEIQAPIVKNIKHSDETGSC